MIHIAHTPFDAPFAPWIARPALLARLWQRLVLWRRRAVERKELATLTPRELRDIGLSRVDAIGEIDKPFWRG